MVNESEHFRRVLLFFPIRVRMQSKREKSCVQFMETCWVNTSVRIGSGNLHLEDAPYSGWPIKADDKIKTLVNVDLHIIREIAEKLKLSNSPVDDHLKHLGFGLKLHLWVPHKLKEIDLVQRITICDLLLKREKNDPFSKQIITGDDKWIVYNNVKRKRSSSRW